MSTAQLRLPASCSDGTLCESCGYIFNDNKPGLVLFGKLDDGSYVWIRFVSGGRYKAPNVAGYRTDTSFPAKLQSVTSYHCDNFNLELIEASCGQHGIRAALRFRLCAILINHYEHIGSPTTAVANYKRLDDYLEVLKWAGK